MNRDVSFTDSDGDKVTFSPSCTPGDVYVETYSASGAQAMIVRLEPAQIEALVSYLLDGLGALESKWPGYIDTIEDVDA